MSRIQILVLSVVCCAFGVLGLYGSGVARTLGLLVNGVLALILAVAAGIDLDRRGFRLAWVVGVSYLLAPLVGLVLYGIFSARPVRADIAAS